MATLSSSQFLKTKLEPCRGKLPAPRKDMDWAGNYAHMLGVNDATQFKDQGPRRTHKAKVSVLRPPEGSEPDPK